MKNTPSKFRKKKVSLSVNGKLPTLSLFPTFYKLHQYFFRYGSNPFNRGEDASLRESDRTFGKYFKDEMAFLSVVQSNKRIVKIVEAPKGKGILISTAWIVDMANVCANPEDYFTDKSYSNSSDIQGNLCLKLLDIAYHVFENDAEVVETTMSDYARGKIHNGSSFNSAEFSNCSLFPYLSKRYEKTSFYNTARKCYPHLDFEAWDNNLNWFKDKLTDKTVLLSEVIRYKSISNA